MSTLKTHNLQSPDAGSVNIAITQNAGMVVAGVSTFSSDLSIADKIVHTGDTDTAIRFPQNDTITAETGGSEKMRLTADGKLGIGTVTPAHKLDVIDGIINVGAAVTTNDSRIQFTRNDTGMFGWIGIPNWNPNSLWIYGPKDVSPYNEAIAQYESEVLKIYTGGTERLHIDSAGDVILKNNGGDNRIERDTTSGGPYLLFHNRGTGTTDSSGVYNMGGISAAGYRDVANPSVVGSIQFERQPTAGGASSGCDIVFRTGFNGTTSHTGVGEKMRLTYGGHLLPGANNQHDLGSTAKGWRNVYMNDLNLSNMNGDTNDVDGTQGSWTIQEGKDDLYIINRLNGKKFKIKMEEIS